LVCKLDWIANSIVFSSSVVIAFGYPFYGFILLLSGNILFIIWGSKANKFSFVFFNILYLINSIHGIIRWRDG